MESDFAMSILLGAKNKSASIKQRKSREVDIMRGKRSNFGNDDRKGEEKESG